jgi:uncharacterized membrane protein YraQ (UPF0718 family)
VSTPVIVRVQDFILLFTSILYEAMPFIVLGALISGVLEELVPQTLITRFIPRRPIFAIAIGALLGLVFPMCECGIIPIMRRLLRKGLPLSCCVAYMLAGPVINVVVIASTWAAFSGMENTTAPNGAPDYQMGSAWMVTLRVGLSYVVAVCTALVVERLHRRHGNSKLLLPLAMPPSLPASKEEEETVADRRPWPKRLAGIADAALHDFVDITVFLILGGLLSAFCRQVIPAETVATLSKDFPVFSILLMMGLAVVLCLCSEADAFIAASYVTLRPSAKVAFLVLGPMLDFKLYLMYTRVFRPRLIFTIFGCVIAFTFVLSFTTHLLWEHYAPIYWNSPPEWYQQLHGWFSNAFK